MTGFGLASDWMKKWGEIFEANHQAE